MSTTTIRVSIKTRNALNDLSKTIGLPMQKVAEQAIEQYRRQYFLDAANVAYARLKANEQAWKSYQDEMLEWDVSLNDGLEDLK